MSVLSTTAMLWRPSTASLTARKTREPIAFKDIAVKVAILVGSLAVLGLAHTHAPWKAARDILLCSTTGYAMAIVGAAYGTVSTVWTFWRLYLAIRYRPVATVDDSQLPTITIVVPAYNEGALVGETLRHLAGAQYPEDRMEIIAVDDGSDDDTWLHIESAAREIGPRVTPVRCPVNRGKRWALWEGFRRGTGSIFVTVDSDSLVAPDSLKALVSPMVQDGRVGAVAGKVSVLNRGDGLIPRMLGVRYTMTFDYKRAAQSMMGGGTVLCCAGALAAYRRSAVLPILNQWLKQTFRGGPARAGEDHAMTNFILKQGFKVRYQRTARVVTKSPATYTALCKMFLRWGRSNIRESIHTSRYVFTRFRPEGKLGIRFNFIMGALGLFLPYPFLVCGLLLALFLPGIFGLKMLASCVFAAFFPFLFCMARERNTEGVFAVPYSLYSTFLLWWIWPYALLTCQKSVWLTRKAGHGSPVMDSRIPQPLPPIAMPEPVALASAPWHGRLRAARRIESPARLLLATARETV
jgi:hyaluronan synthase